MNETANGFLLIEVCNRDVDVFGLYKNHDDAHMALCERLAEALSIPIEVVKESYLSGEELNDVTCVLTDMAWSEKLGQQFDWKIVQLDTMTFIE